MSFTTFPRNRLRADGLPHIGHCMLLPTGDETCEPSERLEPDETTIRVETDMRPRPRPRFGYWMSRQRSMLRGQGRMVLLGVALGCAFFALLRATLGVSIAAPANKAPTHSEAEPRAAAHAALVEVEPRPVARSLDLDTMALAPSMVGLAPPAPVAAAEPRVPLGTCAKTSPHKRASRHHVRRPSCDPPFRFDADGIKRMKLSCL